MNKTDSIKILSSTKCYCGNAKKRGKCFCTNCYFLLKPQMRRSLYAQVGKGFEEAYTNARFVLDEKRPTKSCLWHKGDKPLAEDETPYCPNCSLMLAIQVCDNCSDEFIDWSNDTFDDVIAGPFVTSSGDLACMRCGPQTQREIEKLEEEDAEGWELAMFDELGG